MIGRCIAFRDDDTAVLCLGYPPPEGSPCGGMAAVLTLRGCDFALLPQLTLWRRKIAVVGDELRFTSGKGVPEGGLAVARLEHGRWVCDNEALRRLIP